MKKCIICCIALFIAGAYCFRYHSINTKYPNPKKIEIQTGESYEMNGLIIHVNSGQFMPFSELEAKYPGQAFLMPDPDSTKVLKVSCTVKAKKDTRFALYEVAVQNGLATANPMPGMLMELYDDYEISLSKEESVQVELYYSFIASVFYEEDWENLEDSNWYLEIANTYPYRYLFSIPIREN